MTETMEVHEEGGHEGDVQVEFDDVPSTWPEDWGTPRGGLSYYLSPAGSNSANGMSEGTPWKTFAFALPKLRPGDELVLLDGEYKKSTTGFLSASAGNYSTSAKSGQAGAPITIRAQNERGAWIQGDGSDYPCRLSGLNWWKLSGLRVSSKDMFSSAGGKAAGNFYVTGCKDVLIERGLSHHTNRGFNEHLYTASGCQRVTFLECEGLWGHRHGISSWQSVGVNMIRCYMNARDYAKPTGGYSSNNPKGLDEAYSQYRSSGGMVLNCVAVGSSQGFQVHGGPLNGTSGAGGCDNLFAGCIYIGNQIEYGGKFSSRTVDGKIYAASNNVLVNSLFVNTGRAWSNEDTPGTVMKNITIINTNGDAIQIRENGSYPGMTSKIGNCNVTMRDSIIFGCDSYSFAFRNSHPADIQYCNIFSSRMRSGYRYLDPNETLTDNSGKVRNSFSVKPTNILVADGFSPVWVPPGSNMAQAGQDGKPVGATILYRYESDGTLGTVPLWDPESGGFPMGTMVSGINDVAGQSLFDMHKTLNVSGATLPQGYGT